MPDAPLSNLSADDLNKIALLVKTLLQQDSGDPPPQRLTPDQKAAALQYARENFRHLEPGTVVLHGNEIRGVGPKKQLHTFPVAHVYNLMVKVAESAAAEQAKTVAKPNAAPTGAATK